MNEYIDGDYRVVEHPSGTVERLLITDAPLESPMPMTVTPAQFMVALEQDGLLADIEAWVATQPRMTQIAWSRVLEFRRDSPMLVASADALGWTEEQRTNLFVAAAAVVI